MNSKILLAIIAAAMIVSSGCVSVVRDSDNTSESEIATELEEIDDIIKDMDPDDSEVTYTTGLTDESGEEFVGEDNPLPVKTVKEGEKVSFPNLQAVDPDGDEISYTFSEPLDEDGEWETKVGDAGNYRVTITASDGTNNVAQDVMIIVEALNRAPVIQEMDTIEIAEGETVLLNPVVSDPDGDEVEISFSGWMESSRKKTTNDDAGEHEVVVTATDGTETVSQKVVIRVSDANRAPKLGAIDDVTVSEGDKITVSPSVSDPDGDDVDVSFSDPIGDDGVWQTEIGDAGKYMVKISATDGELNDEETFYITVLSSNAPPVFEGVADLVAYEGDLIELSITASDPEGEDVEIEYSAPFDSEGKWQTGYEDSGDYVVTVKASDGEIESVESFEIDVRESNRPPVFVEGSFE